MCDYFRILQRRIVNRRADVKRNPKKTCRDRVNAFECRSRKKNVGDKKLGGKHGRASANARKHNLGTRATNEYAHTHTLP